jgi:isocitrate/isopropylmalate dehydrogenase
MAEAVLALNAVARLHAVVFEDTHVPFGTTAVAQTGKTFPPATRAAVLVADAVLVAGADEPALSEVMAELDVRARAMRVRFRRSHDVVIVAPLAGDAAEWSLERAFALAERRRLEVAVVGDGYWEELAGVVAARHEDVRVEYLSPKVAMPLAAFDAARFDVIAVSERWAESIGDVVAAPAEYRVVAHALLAEHGPSLFLPAPGGDFTLAGNGVVNPTSMLLAAALLLEHGLQESAAAATLAGAVSAVLVDGPRTLDLLRRGRGASTREFTSRVLASFQMSFRNAEFWPEIAS